MNWYAIRHDLPQMWWPAALLPFHSDIEHYLENVVAPIEDKTGLCLNIAVVDLDVSIYLVRNLGFDYARYFSKAEL